MQSNSSLSKIIGVIVAILVCCSCIAIAIVGAFLYRSYQNTPFNISTPLAPFENTPVPVPTVQINRPPVTSISTETVDTLGQALVPENDPSQLVCELKGTCNIPGTMTPSAPRVVGDKQKFWVSNVDTNKNFQVDAALKYVTPHVYFWVEDGVSYDEKELKDLAGLIQEILYK